MGLAESASVLCIELAEERLQGESSGLHAHVSGPISNRVDHVTGDHTDSVCQQNLTLSNDDTGKEKILLTSGKA